MKKHVAIVLCLGLLCGAARAADAPATTPPPASPKPATRPKAASQPALPKPTLADVAYGPHPKQVMDFWKADSDKPTPLLFYIHGGGWTGGNKASGLGGLIGEMRKAGISVVSIEYRFIPEATADKVVPPVKGPLWDAARALQFVRSKASEWNIDKQRIGASGGSAGACSSLWLDFHPDMADPTSSDPIAHESTRLWCAAVTAAQTTLDPKQMREWTPNSKYGGHAFGFSGDKEKKVSQFDEFYAGREKILPWIAEYSPYALVSSDDPPVYLIYSAPRAGPGPEGPNAHLQLRRQAPGALQGDGRPVRAGLPRRPGRQASDRRVLPDR